MKTLDFSKYAGTYSLAEAEEVAKKMRADIFEAEKQQEIEAVEAIHGSNFTYEICKGTSVNLQLLKQGQQVCACSIKGHHILMTEKTTS